MHIHAVGKALPENEFTQEELIQAAEELWAGKVASPSRIRQLFTSVQVQTRHLALSKHEYWGLQSFTQANAAFIRVGQELAFAALLAGLEKACCHAKDIDVVFFTTVTGLAVPTLDAKLVNRAGLRRDVKRVPLFGLGCVAGAAGIARMYDYLRAFPEQKAILVAVELCSLTFQLHDISAVNLIASGLFGDGAAVVIGSGKPLARQELSPRVIATRSAFYYNSEAVMGWDIGSEGFKLVLSAEVPSYVTEHLRVDVLNFLQEHGLGLRDIRSWVCHSGGPKVLQAFEDAFDLHAGQLQLTWNSLSEVGNLSSASVLFVLEETMRERRGNPGDLGIILAMGPGFCAEMVLFRWE